MAIARPLPEVARAPARHAVAIRSPRALWVQLGLTRQALDRAASWQWTVGAPVAVIAAMFAGAALEPAPASESRGLQAAIDSVLATIFFVGILASALGAVSLRRWGIGAAFAVALLSLGLVVTCPISGHHTVGLWFAGEMGCVLAATGIAGAGLWRTNR